VSTWQADNAYAQPAGTNAVPSAARTATGQSAALRVFGDKVNFFLDVTAVSGTTPSYTFTVEWSHDGTTWFPAATPDTLGAAVTAQVKRVHTVDAKGPFCRVVWTVTGTTPSATFAIHLHSLDY
jgi:hypothetical protein